MSVSGNYLKLNFRGDEIVINLKNDSLGFKPLSVKLGIAKAVDSSGNLIQYDYADPDGSETAGYTIKCIETSDINQYMENIHKSRILGNITHYVAGMTKEVSLPCKLEQMYQRSGLNREIEINFVVVNG